uniref:RRM domain-containing protein n=1 Tax=Panagrolaimus sp. ES5 TaxID=591445 RepID=A0AC34FDF2_9BILA
MKKDHGWVPITVLLRCNAVRRLTLNKAVIAEVLEDSDLIDVSDDGQKVRRNPEFPLPENMPQYWHDLKKRTVFIRGFPHCTSSEEIMEFLKPFGDVVNVITQKHKHSREFRGAVFVTFKDREEALSFIQNVEANTFHRAQLFKMMQNDCTEKMYSLVVE